MNKIAKELQSICLEVDKNITNLPEKKAKLWAKSNAIRHALTVEAILQYANKHNKKQIKILNASGINCGHQDFSICNYLKNNTDLEVSWTVYDSPENKYLESEAFKESVKKLNIDLKLSHFNNLDQLYGSIDNEYDIVLFTEIAEHLEYSVLLNCLIAIRKKLKDGGIIFVTTPNLLSLVNRIHLLLGNGDKRYYGDGIENLRKSIYGHIVLYDIHRLKRILADIGFKTIKGQTFNDNSGADKTNIFRILIMGIIEMLSNLIKNSKRRLLIVAEKSDRVKTPFKT